MGLGGLTETGAEALSAGLGFLGNLGGSVAGGLFSANQARKNRKFQERMYKQQVQDNINFWKMQQEYNLPSAQLQRIRDAGLSALLAYGDSGLSGNIAGSAPQAAQAPHGAQAQVSSFNTRFDMANLALVEAQARDLNASADMKDANARNTNLNSDITEATKDVQIAMKYSDLDLLNESIRKLSADRYNDAVLTAEQAATLAQGRLYQIKAYNLSEQEVANALMLGLENVAIGKTQASAAYKNACANLKNAMTAAYLAPAQKAALVENAAKLALENKFYNETMSDRKWMYHSQARSASFQAQADSWLPVLRESGISETQSKIFMNYMQGEMYKTQTGDIEFRQSLTPLDMLINLETKGKK